MKEVTLYIQENKFQFFMDIIRNFDFVKVNNMDAGDSKKEILANIKSGLDELKQIEKGKKKARSANEFLNEL